MRIDEYKNICDNVQISDTVLASYQNAIDQIKAENVKIKKKNKLFRWREFSTVSKVAIIFGVLFVLSGSAAVSVKAYMSHMEKLRNMQDEEVIGLYENVFQYDSGYMSRPMTEAEDRRYAELYDLYYRDMTEPEGEVEVISSKTEYKGEGLAFSTEDGILYVPEREMSDEEILQMVAFNLLRQYVVYEAYVKASNPLYYMNYLEQMTMQEVDEIYITYHSANTETSFCNRELSFEELGRKKVLKMLYKNSGQLPEHTIPLIQNASDYKGEGIAFCISNCTYYFPDTALSDEELLELIDFQIKVEYCWRRIDDEIARGIRSHWPYIEYVERDRIETLDPNLEVEDSVLNQPWLSAYAEILKQYYQQIEEESKKYSFDPEDYYANVCFIYLNDDEIPEMLFSHGYTPTDYDDRCNIRTYLYTYKDGAAVLLSPGDDTIEDYYGYRKPFSYVERKGMVYCDYYYPYSFTTYDNETDIIDNVDDNMSRMDIWDLDTMTLTSSDANIQMLHAVYNYMEEECEDADFSYEYYVNVSDIIRDATTGNVKEIVGEKVTLKEYEASEAALWNGEQVTQLSVNDFDKIYRDDNLLEALAQCYMKSKV
ncbi:MAG: hypothetical protein J1E83_05695 [Lachnospiraceae bacterium]|nr:hypothetical protein [Lachnospiraceae bacterium]